MQRNRFFIASALVSMLAWVFTLGGVSPIAAQSDSETAVRFVHVIPGVGEIDVYINGGLSVSGLGFGEATTYINVPEGTNNLRVTLKGLSSTLWEQPVSVPATEKLILVASSTDPLNFATYRDDPTPLALGSARVMVIHAVAGASNVDFRVNGDLIVSDVAYGSFVNSIDVPANVYDMGFTVTGDENNFVVNEAPVALNSLTTQVLVLYGTSARAASLTLTSATNAEGDAGAVRFVNAGDGVQAVDVLLDGALIIPALSEATEHLALPVGSYSVAFQDSLTKDVIAVSQVEVAADAVQTVVSAGGAVTAFADDVSAVQERETLVNVINVAAGAADVQLTDSGVVLAEGLATGAAAAVNVSPATDGLTVSVTPEEGDALVLDVPASEFYGGVYYTVVVFNNGEGLDTVVAATSLARTFDSAPGAADVDGVAVVVTEDATEATEATATEEAAAEATTEVVTEESTEVVTEEATVEATPEAEVTEVVTEAPTAEATPEPTVAAPTTAPTPSNPTARVVLDPGANLHLREFPSADARSLGRVPSGTVLTVNGREGAALDSDGNELLLEDETEYVDPVTLLEEGEDLTPADTWLNVTYDTPDGGTITAWVNALYLTVSDPRGLRQVLAELPTVAGNLAGNTVNTGITSPTVDAEYVTALVTQLDPGINLNIRRTAQSSGEVLARVASGTSLQLIGFGDSGDWAFIRHFPLEGGNVTGWVSTLYLTYLFRDAPILPDEMNARGLIELVDEATRRGAVSSDAVLSPVSPTQEVLRNVIVGTVVPLNDGIFLNLRRTPDAGGEVLTKLPPATQFVVLSRDLSGDWLETEFNGERGWVSTAYVTLSFNQLSASIEDVPLNEALVVSATGTPTETPTPEGGEGEQSGN